MKKKIVCLTAALCLVLCAALPSFGASFFYGKTPLDIRMGGLSEFITEVQEEYKDEVDLDTLFNGMYKGMFEALGDPWSYYFSYDDGREYYTTTDENYEGIGVMCRAFDDGELLVTAIMKGSPADAAGIKSGDIIVKIGNEKTMGMDSEKAVALLRGKPGSSVTLTIEREEDTLLKNIIREKIENKSTVSSEMKDGGIAYIKISHFDPGTAKEFKAAFTKLSNKSPKGLILDIRGNGGGYLEEAISVADCLLPYANAEITRFVKQGKVIDKKYSTFTGPFSFPVVCLVDKDTASASELLAAALKENRAAKIVGETTYGKGVAQVVEDTVQNHGYRLSVYYFTAPRGKAIDGAGVLPDIAVKNGGELSKEQAEGLTKDLAPMNEAKKYRAGESGLNVYGAQQRLRALGYDVSLTSVMDSKTVAAVKKLQEEIGGYPYPCLDYGTMKGLERLFNEFINGSGEDLQLKAAEEYLLKK